MEVPQTEVPSETLVNLEVMNALIKAIEAKDPYTAGHVWRVSQYV